MCYIIFVCIQALDFDLRVFHPQTAIHAFLAEIRCDYSYLNLSYGMDEVNDLIRKWVPRAEKAASILMVRVHMETMSF